MADGKKSFVAYADWKEVFESLPNEQAGKLIKHIFAYVNDENPTTDDFIVNALFIQIKSTLKRDLGKWEKQKEQRKLAGQKSAEMRKAKSTEVQRNPTNVDYRSISLNEKTRNPTVSVNDSVSVSVSGNVSDKEYIQFDSVEETSTTPKIKSISDRKETFKNLLSPFENLYDKNLLNDFCAYWTEHGINDKKMRFEKEKSFEVGRRLGTWKKNEKNFNKGNFNVPKKTAMEIALEVMQEKHG